jgi:hypothetical protein
LNVGSDTAYNVNFTVVIGDGITVGDNITVDYVLQDKNLTLFTGFFLPPGTPLSVMIPLNFSAFNFTQEEAASISSRLFIVSTSSAMDLTSTPGEDRVYEALDKSIEYPLILTFANLTGDPDGYTVHLNITTDAEEFGYEVRYLWWRKDLNFQNGTSAQDEWYILSNTTEAVLTDHISGQSSPKIDYMVTVTPISGQSIITQSNVYHFAPKSNSKKWWIPLAIALPIGLAVVALLIAGAIYVRKNHPELFASAAAKKPKKLKQSASVPLGPVTSFTAVEKAPGDETLAAPASPPPASPVDPRKPAKQYTVNIDYLMTGARRVVVKDGNPTSAKPPEDYTEPEEGKKGEDDIAAAEEGGSSGAKGGKDKKGRKKKGWIRRLFPCL